MLKLRSVVVLLVLFLNPSLILSLKNGLALTPPMGWSTWNVFRCDYTERDLMEIADLLVSSGMSQVGYEYLNIDDCWEDLQRDPLTKMLKFNETKFPNGISSLADYVHSKGLKLGLYTSSGERTCQNYPGSWEHEYVDAQLFSSWKIDFLKVDCCYQNRIEDRIRAYTNWSQALLQQNRSIIFSCDTDELILNENNFEFPFEWAPEYCHMARIYWDIYDQWEQTLNILDHAANIYFASRPGYWNDLDILTVGLGQQTLQEYISQFSLWSLLSSPLIAGNDLRQMNQSILNILTNKEVIAINQDRLGRSGNMIQRAMDGSYEIWAKALFHENNCSYHAVVLFNRSNQPTNITLQFEALFDNALSPHPPSPIWSVNIRDLWLHQDQGTFTHNWTSINVQPHGVTMITVLLQTN